jgi:hypothetical protein
MVNVLNKQIELDNLLKINKNKYCYMQGDIRLEIFRDCLILNRGLNEFGNPTDALDLLELGLYEKVITALKYNKKFEMVEG